jgi:hypothetical protein
METKMSNFLPSILNPEPIPAITIAERGQLIRQVRMAWSRLSKSWDNLESFFDCRKITWLGTEDLRLEHADAMDKAAKKGLVLFDDGRVCIDNSHKKK